MYCTFLISRPQVAFATQLEGNGLEPDALDLGDGGEHFEALSRYLGTDTIARHDTDRDHKPLQYKILRPKSITPSSDRHRRDPVS